MSNRTDDLEKNFDLALIEGYYQIKEETGYNATYFLQMVQDQGGLQAARNLLSKPEPSEGLFSLWELKRLDLSLEAFVLTEKYSPLFTKQELIIAHQRLADLGYYSKDS